MAVKNYGIHDKWTNISKVNNIEIQSVDGVIENIKVNGEPAGGGGGSSDFSTAEVTFTKSGVSGSLVVPFYVDGEQPFSSGQIVESGTYTMILYKGFCFATFIQDGTGTFNIVGNGDVEVDGTDIYITGDCTITIS